MENILIFVALAVCVFYAYQAIVSIFDLYIGLLEIDTGAVFDNLLRLSVLILVLVGLLYALVVFTEENSIKLF